jgi:hypothetical protein
MTEEGDGMARERIKKTSTGSFKEPTLRTWNVMTVNAKTHSVMAERLIVHTSGALIFCMPGDPEDQPKEVVPAGQWTWVTRRA